MRRNVRIFDSRQVIHLLKWTYLWFCFTNESLSINEAPQTNFKCKLLACTVPQQFLHSSMNRQYYRLYWICLPRQAKPLSTPISSILRVARGLIFIVFQHVFQLIKKKKKMKIATRNRIQTFFFVQSIWCLCGSISFDQRVCLSEAEGYPRLRLHTYRAWRIDFSDCVCSRGWHGNRLSEFPVWRTYHNRQISNQKMHYGQATWSDLSSWKYRIHRSNSHSRSLKMQVLMCFCVVLRDQLFFI